MLSQCLHWNILNSVTNSNNNTMTGVFQLEPVSLAGQPVPKWPICVDVRLNTSQTNQWILFSSVSMLNISLSEDQSVLIKAISIASGRQRFTEARIVLLSRQLYLCSLYVLLRGTVVSIVYCRCTYCCPATNSWDNNSTSFMILGCGILLCAVHMDSSHCHACVLGMMLNCIHTEWNYAE